MIHPAEAFGYFCILFSPAFALPKCHVAAFLAYMALMGTCGVLDHSGIRFSLALPLPFTRGKGKGGKRRQQLLLYDSADHDVHHMSGYGARAVNLGFPFPALDKLHGTYVAPADAHAARAASAAAGGGAGGGSDAGVRGGGGGTPQRRSARTRAG